ncbi:hypothetical protein IGB42_01252 [Andreprevotia sp. IGB-42]|uniref:hypothetical protein n=1 Tax=Andreprevotia sp. IGB-42 TaxID=2497473 RepID=UPI00135A5F81|nr:hypothetical protein [Andreprevotia sp. IGB-42]KAF0814351.1 hypothetical protein IGB42_01252 [Andreprevotia sp. IGB-42]
MHKPFVISALLAAMLAAAPAIAADAAKAPDEVIAVADGAKISAKIESIDPATRVVTLVQPNGEILEAQIDKKVKNFDQLKVGDVVSVKVNQAVAVALLKGQAGIRKSVEGEGTTKAGAGESPSTTKVQTETITADVLGVDKQKGLLKVKGPKNRIVTTKVKNKALLKDVEVGDQIQVSYRRAVAVWVEVPAAK